MDNYYRIRHTFKNGPDEDWDYVYSPHTLEDLQLIMEYEFDWNPRYTGCIVEKVYKPPLEWLRTQIEDQKLLIKYRTLLLARFEEKLSELLEEQ